MSMIILRLKVWELRLLYVHTYIFCGVVFFNSVLLNTKNLKRAIGLMSRVFANGLGDQDSKRGRVIPMTQKMVLDAGLLNTQHYKISIKDKVEQSRE